jgi:hypothetical protein
LGDGYDYSGPRSAHNLPHDSLPDYDPDFGTVVLDRHARLTDVLSSVILPVGFLVNGKVRQVLSGFGLPPHRYFDVAVRFRRKPVDGYYWLHLPEVPVTLADKMAPEEAEAALAASFPLDTLDLIRMARPQRYAYCFVSDRLRRALESAKITGIRLARAKLFRRPPSAGTA